jgi:hypothetical protein
MWEGREVHTGFWWGNLKETGHCEDLGLDGKISGLGKGELASSCAHGKARTGSIKCRKF